MKLKYLLSVNKYSLVLYLGSSGYMNPKPQYITLVQQKPWDKNLAH